MNTPSPSWMKVSERSAADIPDLGTVCDMAKSAAAVSARPKFGRTKIAQKTTATRIATARSHVMNIMTTRERLAQNRLSIREHLTEEWSKGERVVIVYETPSSRGSGDEYSEQSGDSSEDDVRWRRAVTGAQSEYYNISKLIGIIRLGDEVASLLALTFLNECDFKNEVNVMALRDTRGFDLLVNLLGTQPQVRLASLDLLEKIVEDHEARHCLLDLGIIPVLVRQLGVYNTTVTMKAARVLGCVARNKRAWRDLRKYGALERLINQLDISDELIQTKAEEDSDNAAILDAARSAAVALIAVSKSRKNRSELMTLGIVPLLIRWTNTVHRNVLAPIIGVIKECGSEPCFQQAAQTKEVVAKLVQFLSDESRELQYNCVSALFQSGRNAMTRELVRVLGGLGHLVKLMSDPVVRNNKAFLADVVGAVWALSGAEENVHLLVKMDVVRILAGLLGRDDTEEVESRCVGCLGEIAFTDEYRTSIMNSGVISNIIGMMRGDSIQILRNAAYCLGRLAQNSQCVARIDKSDGVELTWSLLKNSDKKVQSTAALALCDILNGLPEPGEVVRSVIGAMELTIELLATARDPYVLASLCSLVEKISQDIENLHILTDMGLVSRLSSLVYIEDEFLQQHVARAIGSACKLRSNARELGLIGVVVPLLNFVSDSTSIGVKKQTIFALSMLSTEPYNCVLIHSKKVVSLLLDGACSDDIEMREYASMCLSNIRKLALECEKLKCV